MLEWHTQSNETRSYPIITLLYSESFLFSVVEYASSVETWYKHHTKRIHLDFDGKSIFLKKHFTILVLRV